MRKYTLLAVVLLVVTTIVIGIPKASSALSNTMASEIETDRVALLAIMSKITLDPHKVLLSWNKSVHVCLWEGVTCGRRHKRVTQLNLTAKGVVGTLSPFVGNLTFLNYLSLHNNTFSGLIPPQVGRLARLRNLNLIGNQFEGGIPPNISACSQLVHLNLYRNKLSGKIPFELNFLSTLKILALDNNNLTGDNLSPLSNLTSLQELYLSGQNERGGPGFRGAIPEFIGNFKHLTILSLGGNSFTGKIPSSLYNLSKLQALSLSSNLLEGSLLPDIGFFLPQLKLLELNDNHFSGPVPFSLSNLSSLEYLQIGENNFTGKFLFDARNMKNLQYFHIYSANLGTGEADDLNFLDTLVNSSQLQSLVISDNHFGGSLPQSIVHLSTNKLQHLIFESNQISGSIPSGLSRYVNLELLSFSDNHFTGTIPQDIGKITKLERAFFNMNQLSGSIPMSVGDLSMLSHLSLSLNKFQGSIPATLGNCKNLQKLYLYDNNLVGNVPYQLFQASSLIIVDIHNNHLQGSLPSEVGELKQLVGLYISNNNITSSLPSTLDQCVMLRQLNLSINSFVGSIPSSLSLLKSLEWIDLSSNKLSGQVPAYFSNFSNLMLLNLSFNDLEGDVPSGGVFANLSATTLIGNSKLCGGIPELKLPTCPKAKSHWKAILIITVSISCVLVGLAILCSVFLLRSRRRRRRRNASSPSSLGDKLNEPLVKVSYAMLLKATSGFSAEKLIGSGSYGFVYKGALFLNGEEQIVAIKVVNNHRQGAGKSFKAECKALRSIRHRNLVRVITACSSIDFQGRLFRALVYELIPKGSLERWLYSNPEEDGEVSKLTLLQRLNIAIDVANALDYLHNGNDTPIIHCDLKPTNILLDDDMVAHVGDFGLVKLLPQVSEQLYSSSSIGVRGTVGYVAPEYGLGSCISASGDVYSYGIILLELMTTKKPTDSMFEGGMNLQKFVESALPNRVLDIVDPKLRVDDHDDDEDDREIRINSNDARGSVSKCVFECITSMIKTGIRCSTELPRSRMDIKEVIQELHSQRGRLLLCGRHRCQRIL